MKSKTAVMILPFVALLAAAPLHAGKGFGQGFGDGNPGRIQPAPLPVEQAALSDEEIADMIYLREEEKLARDVYISLHEIWGSPVFANISGAEQRHMDSVRNLLEKYAVEDPVTDDSVGVFTNQELAALYQELVDRGGASLEEALHVGAYIEELDIGDVEANMTHSDHTDIVRVYENLDRGSRNHLRAFVGQIESMGILYEAQLLSQEQVDEIVNSPMERGGKGGRGKGRR